MKRLYLKIIIFNILWMAIVYFAEAQRSNGLAVEGKVTTEEGSVDGAIIQMFRDGQRIGDYGIPSGGRYKVELNYNHKFELIFKRDGNFSQKIDVITEVPQNVLQSDPSFPPFPVDINLFTEVPGIDNSFSENAILKIYYSDDVDNFISERYYNNAQIKNLIDQAIVQSQMINKEADYLAKLTKAELAELRKEYQQLLDGAEKDYSAEKFLDALDGYEAASRIFPNEQYPKDRIAEINDLLGLLMVAEDMNQARQARLETLLKQADLQYTQLQYPEARNSYNRALSIDPGNQHAKQRIAEINDLLRRQQLEKDYNAVVALADNAFNEMLYEEAISKYNEALTIKQNEAYPRQKINEINGILAKQAKSLENQESYKQAVFQAQLSFEKQFYDKALASYEQALSFKPGDALATRKIEEIKSLMQRLANKTLYDRYIKTADKAFDKERFDEALVDYEKAHELLPDEAHARNQIALIRQRLGGEEDFANWIRQADLAFNQKDYVESKKLYNQALEIHSEDKHALARVDEIDALLAGLATDERYNNLVVQADQLLDQKNYNNAISTYQEALEVKPNERYPKQKVAEINSILADIEKANERYRQILAQGDELFNQKNYDDAKTAFLEAGAMKPEDVYPKEMLAKIDSAIASQAQLLAEQQAAEKERLAAQARALDEQYQAIVDEANSLVNENELVAAVGKLREAIDIKPNEQYPLTRIEEIRGMITRQQEVQKAYEEAITKADQEFKRESFDAAVAAYNTAKQAKSDEVYPDEMLAKIDSIVTTRARLAAEAEAAEQARLAALQREKDSLYNAAIARADGLFTSEDYENSRTAYRSALDIKPEETYPQQRIDEIGNLLAQLSAAQKAYEEAIAEADREFKRESFDAAIAAYNAAKQAKSDEVYPDEMLAKIDSIITTRARLAAEAEAAEQARLTALQREKDSLYNAAIARADGLFTSEDYENSRTAYRSALDIKPEETYPQQRIDEIGNLLAQLSAAQKAYEEAITKADQEFKRESFDAAIAAYNTAKQAKSDEVYPDEMLAKIDSIITTRARLAAEAEAAEQARLAALQREKDSLYNAAITRADGLFNSEDYENSRTAYRSALDIKPEETYPQQRIDEIGNLLAQLSAAQKAYEEAITKADQEFKRESFDAAIAAYNTAKQAKSDEVYQDEMLAKIDSIITTRARLAAEAEAAEQARLAALQREKDSLYNAAITRADGLFNSEDYENSRTAYRSALDIKPEETYPQQRIDEIGNLLAQLSAAQKAYEEAIAEADREFKRESFDAAIAAYYTAKQAKSDEVYPDEMLAKIDSIVTTRARLAAEAEAAEQARLAALQREKDSLYNAAITRADGLFNSEDYENSRTAYRSALDIKPEETYPQQRIDEIGNLLAQLSAAQKAYEEAITKADQEFKRESFDAAIAAYNTAKQAKSDEVYPDEMLAKIDSIVTTRARLAAEAEAAEQARLAALQREKDSLYNAAITRADALFASEDYESSRTAYRSALDIKPEETYPQQRIDEIGNLLAQLAAKQKEQEILNRNYASAIQAADRYFAGKNYDLARTNYTKALEFKPEEAYPVQQIGEIDRLLEVQKLDEQYRKIVLAADGYFNTKSYDEAKNEYQNALGLKPGEEYPKNQITKINTILDDQQKQLALQQQAEENLERRRQQIQQQQAEINEQQIFSEAELTNLYNQYITQADQTFNSKLYNVSRAWYYRALDVKPEELYPQQRINEINQLVKGLLLSQRDRDYQNYVDLGDSTFRANQLAVSRGWYNQALNIKPNETYPREQLDAISKLIAERIAGQSGQLFESHVEKANNAFESQNYNVARFWYKQALTLRPNETALTDKLKEIEELLK